MIISEPPVEQERETPATARETPKREAPPETIAPDEPSRRHWLRWLLILAFVVLAVYLFMHRPGTGPDQGQTQGGKARPRSRTPRSISSAIRP